MCQVGIFHEGRSSSIAIGLSNEGKSLFNKACGMPWCHTVVHFEVKIGFFTAVLREDCLNRGGTSAKQALFLPH